MKTVYVKGLLAVIFFSLCLGGLSADTKAVNEETLTIVATVIVKQEFKDDVLKAIKTVVDATRKEPGCIFYDVYEDIKNPLKFVFIETWKSQAAIDSHNKASHFNDFVKAIDGKTTLDVSTLKQKF